LGAFYHSLLKSEARHFKDYLALAERYAVEPIAPRVAFFSRKRAALN
jgi:tRNA-(ms[2]io[6]A)-hydroxylase